MSRKIEARIRKCAITHQRRQKHELLRVVRVADEVIIDIAGQLRGRGAYLLPDVEVIKKAKKKNALARALRMKIDVQIYDQLLQIVMDGDAQDVYE